jgi:hypothetical protein
MSITYGWQSKRYEFGAGYVGEVADHIQPGIPSRLLGIANYRRFDVEPLEVDDPQPDHVRIAVQFGGALDEAGPGTVNVTPGKLTFSQAPDSLAAGYLVTVGSGNSRKVYTLKQPVVGSTTEWEIVGGQAASSQPWTYTAEVALVDTAAGIDRREEEISLLSFPALLTEDEWYVRYRIEITTDTVNLSPNSPDWPFINSETVDLYFYRDLLTQSVLVRPEPLDTRLDRRGRPRTSSTPEFMPLAGVQVVFYFANTPLRFRAYTAVTDNAGRITAKVPPAQYNIEFYGAGARQSEWLTNYTVGAGEHISPWKGSSSSRVSQAAEFGFLKAQFSTLYWPGYVVMEDFAPERQLLRDESDVNLSYVNNYAWHLFGRVFAGKSFVDYLGIAIDPPPE